MALFDTSSLNEGVRKREVFGWAMYDFANSGYTTVVLTAVFNAYFVGVVAANASWATLAWTSALALSSAIVMLTMPSLGACADLRASKKRLLAFSTAGCVLATALLALAGPGDLWLAVAAIVLSNIFYSYGESLNAAFLPELARRDALGRVSGWGWSFGYFGGMLTLGLSLGYVLWAQAQGIPATQFVPVTMLITAGVYALASLLTFALLRERAVPQPAALRDSGLRASLARLAQTWRQAQRLPRLRLAAGLRGGLPGRHRGGHRAGRGLCRAGAGLQADADDDADLPGQHRLGRRRLRLRLLAGPHRPPRALAVTLVGWIVMTLLAVAATSAALFWVAAVIAGLCMGSSQSAGRAMAGLPSRRAHRLAEFFGLWTFAMRLAAILGPMTYGLVTCSPPATTASPSCRPACSSSSACWCWPR